MGCPAPPTHSRTKDALREMFAAIPTRDDREPPASAMLIARQDTPTLLTWVPKSAQSWVRISPATVRALILVPQTINRPVGLPHKLTADIAAGTLRGVRPGARA